MRGRWMDGSADVSSLPADLRALPPRIQQHGDIRAVHDGVPVEISGAGRTARPPCGNIGQDDEDLLYRGIHRGIAQAMPAMANANGILEIVIKCREDSTTQMHELKRTCSL